MLSKRFILEREQTNSPGTANLEQIVMNFIMEWHYEDNLQEVINMALGANNIPAQVVKVGDGADSIKFIVQPFPAGNKFGNKKLVSGFDKLSTMRR